MNVQYLKDNNLMEAHKQFMRLCEWSYIPESLEEDGPDEQDPNAQGGADPMAGGDDPMNGGAPQDDDSLGLDTDMPSDEDTSEGDEVIDVDDITNAEEKVFDRVNKVGKNLGKMDDKFSKLMSSLDSMLQKIDSQNAEIEALKSEFGRRNPTPTEKLDLRSLDSYPFNVKPTEYWREKSASSNYQADTDNSPMGKEDYEITDEDINDYDDRDIADSFYVDDDMKQDLKKIFEL